MTKISRLLLVVLLSLLMAASAYAAGNDSNTVLLVHGDTSFIDTSIGATTAPQTITNNGAQVYYNPINQQSYIYFDENNGGNIYLGNDSNFIPTSDWTFDAWVKLLPTSDNSNSIFRYHSGHHNYGGIGFGIGNGKLGFSISTGNGINPIPLFSLQDDNAFSYDDAWHHVAIVRSGNVWYLYRDGEIIKQDTYEGTVPSFNTFYLGGNRADGEAGTIQQWYFGGYMTEVRMSKGIARWTTNFTLPSSPYTTDSYTKILIHSNTDTESQSFIDDSGSYLLSANSYVKHVPVVKKFNGSMYFDGSSSLLIDDSEDWNFGTGDFTIDTWVNFSDFNDTDNYIINQMSDPDGDKWELNYKGGDLRFFASGSSGEPIILTHNISLDTDTWYHIAVTRSGTNFNLYLDGVSVANSSTSIDNSMLNLSYDLVIGGSTSDAGYSNVYLDELRISKGIARTEDPNDPMYLTIDGDDDGINDSFNLPTSPYSYSAYPLSVSISTDVTSGYSPLAVNFTSTATGGTWPYSYSWDFDGDSVADSTDQNPSYTYTVAGTYSASVIITDADGDSVTATQTIQVLSDDCLTHSVYDSDTMILTIPYLDIALIDPITQQESGEFAVFECKLKLVQDSVGNFSVEELTYLEDQEADSTCHASYSYEGIMYIPNVDVITVVVLPPDIIVQAETLTYDLTLKQLPISTSLFNLETAILKE